MCSVCWVLSLAQKLLTAIILSNVKAHFVRGQRDISTGCAQAFHEAHETPWKLHASESSPPASPGSPPPAPKKTVITYSVYKSQGILLVRWSTLDVLSVGPKDYFIHMWSTRQSFRHFFRQLPYISMYSII